MEPQGKVREEHSVQSKDESTSQPIPSSRENRKPQGRKDKCSVCMRARTCIGVHVCAQVCACLDPLSGKEFA